MGLSGRGEKENKKHWGRGEHKEKEGEEEEGKRGRKGSQGRKSQKEMQRTQRFFVPSTGQGCDLSPVTRSANAREVLGTAGVSEREAAHMVLRRTLLTTPMSY